MRRGRLLTRLLEEILRGLVLSPELAVNLTTIASLESNFDSPYPIIEN